MKAPVFIGAGRITAALIAGLRLAGYDKPIVVHDHHPQNLRRLKKQLRIDCEPDLARAIAQANPLIIAVRPRAVRDLLRNIVANRQLTASPRKQPLVAISLAAGIPLKQLRSQLGPPVRWARAMPSPVCRSAKGLTGLVFSGDLSSSDRRKIRSLFSRVGGVLEIAEKQFDAFSVTYSSSHGYHALAALAASAMKVGLNPNAAFTAAAHALADGIQYWREGSTALKHLLDEAATPGGVAAATMAAMDRAGYRNAVGKGVLAGLRRTRANARL